MDNNPLIIENNDISSSSEKSNERNNINKSGESEQTYITIFERNSSISSDERNRTESVVNKKPCLIKFIEYCINSKILAVICNPIYWIGTSIFIGIVLIIWIIINAALK